MCIRDSALASNLPFRQLLTPTWSQNPAKTEPKPSQNPVQNASKFDVKYGNTDLTVGYVLRYYFYTGIDLNADKTELISMNIQSFPLQESDNSEQITREAISEIRQMSFGSQEFKEFVEKYFSGCVDYSKVVNNCVFPTVYEPVCGCNGLTYSNSSAAACDGVTNYQEGPCP